MYCYTVVFIHSTQSLMLMATVDTRGRKIARSPQVKFHERLQDGLVQVFNSATHPPRFWLGVWLAGGHYRWQWLVLVFLFAIGMSASRRSVDLIHCSWKSRRSLASYSRLNLLIIKIAVFGMIVVLWIVSRPTFHMPYIVTVCAYAVCVGGIEAVPRIRSLFERLWLR